MIGGGVVMVVLMLLLLPVAVMLGGAILERADGVPARPTTPATSDRGRSGLSGGSRTAYSPGDQRGEPNR